MWANPRTGEYVLVYNLAYCFPLSFLIHCFSFHHFFFIWRISFSHYFKVLLPGQILLVFPHWEYLSLSPLFCKYFLCMQLVVFFFDHLKIIVLCDCGGYSWFSTWLHLESTETQAVDSSEWDCSLLDYLR